MTEPTPGVFNEASLRQSIAGVWGYHGAHMDLYDTLLARLVEAERLLRRVDEECFQSAPVSLLDEVCTFLEAPDD